MTRCLCGRRCWTSPAAKGGAFGDGLNTSVVLDSVRWIAAFEVCAGHEENLRLRRFAWNGEGVKMLNKDMRRSIALRMKF